MLDTVSKKKKKQKHSCTVSEKVNWSSHYWEKYGGYWKKLKTELGYDPAIPLLGIYLEKTIIQKDTCTLVFTVALFTIAKMWKPLKCSLTDRWIKKIWYMCTMEYYSATKERNLGHLQWCGWTYSLSYRVKSEENKYCILIHMYRI